LGNFITHVNTVLGCLREAPITSLSTDPTTEAYRAQVAVRRAIARVWNAKQWAFKKAKRVLSFSPAADSFIGLSRVYALLPDIGDVYAIESSAQPFLLTPIREAALYDAVAGRTDTGVPEVYALGGPTGRCSWTGVQSLNITATNPTADAGKRVTVRGVTSYNQVQEEEVTIPASGTIFTTNSFYYPVTVSKEVTAAPVYVYTTSGFIYTSIPAHASFQPDRELILFPTPASTTQDFSLTVFNFAPPPVPQNASSASGIPDRWDYVVDQFGFALALQSKGQDQGTEYNAQLQVAIKFLEEDMVGEEEESAEEIIQPGKWAKGGSIAWNNFPPNYNVEE